MKEKLPEHLQDRALSRRLLPAGEDRQGEVRRPAGAPGDLDADRPRLHRRRGLAGDDAAGLRAGAAGDRQLRRGRARARLCRRWTCSTARTRRSSSSRRPGSIRRRCEIQLSYNSSENHRNTMAAVADNLSNVGIKSTLNEMEGTNYFNYLREGGDFDIVRAGWIGDYSDPQNFLYLNEIGRVVQLSRLDERRLRLEDARRRRDHRPRRAGRTSSPRRRRSTSPRCRRSRSSSTPPARSSPTRSRATRTTSSTTTSRAGCSLTQ